MLSNLVKVTQIASGGEKLNTQIGSKYCVRLESQCCSSCKPEVLNPRSIKKFLGGPQPPKIIYIKL